MKRFDSLGVKFKKRPEDGRMKVGLSSTSDQLPAGLHGAVTTEWRYDHKVVEMCRDELTRIGDRLYL